MPTGSAASLKIVWAGLFAGMLFFLGISVFVRAQNPPTSDLGVLTWMSIAWAVLSTVTGYFLRSVASEEKDEARRRGLTIASFAVVESGVFLVGTVHLVSPLDFGIYAALVPVGAMLALFPRQEP
jgi:hypothetical protein